MNTPVTTATLERMEHGTHFRAFTLRGDDQTALIDPFLGVDHAWMSGPTFPPHPHAGFSAVSYLFLDSETSIQNRDALGDTSIIKPGGLHWTAAGRGIVHEEVPVEVGKTVHSLQIFVNLPVAHQAAAPQVLRLAPEQVPVVRLPGASVRVVSGKFNQVESPFAPPTPIQLLDIDLEGENAEFGKIAR
ncbi:redox-sensitive bicupin YhaK (pirin superfamily) [Oxalobacteraceae bacterium GrIS 1.11]